MITIRKAQDRGATRIAWLDSRHTFSFGEYYDPAETGFSVLRVINDDRVAPGGGFPSHGHRDMEIVTYVLEGALEHRDNLGTNSVIPAGDLQRMTAGTGIVHSEFNHSKTQAVHFLQIWILPSKSGLEPGYEQETLDKNPPRGQLRLVAAPHAQKGALKINQDARMYLGTFDAGQSAAAQLDRGRSAYFHVVRGKISINGVELGESDGARVSDEPRVDLSAAAPAEVLFFDLP
ncbi:MAG TPA: pirin family protein [Candidatus Binataceae bacterium]|jgi:redox-sensitive bicupin YhaK (pirin superfamily)|nr:pirin family protein [Candidatus Binataceae bacterium]